MRFGTVGGIVDRDRERENYGGVQVIGHFACERDLF